MRAYSLSHVSDHDLLRGLASLVAQDRTTTATLLAHIAEVDARKLYLPAAARAVAQVLFSPKVDRAWAVVLILAPLQK